MAAHEDAGRPATIYDVARAAGVSHQTVSRFLRGYEGIRPHTRERVEQALATLDYRPNLTARSLKSGTSHIVAALTHELAQVGPARTAEGATAAAREAGYVLDLITLDVHDPRAIERTLGELRQRRLAGVLALSSTDEMNRAFAETAFGVPFHIHAEADEPGGGATELAVSGIPQLIAHLADLGHERLVHVAGAANWSASRNRARAVAAAAARAGIEVVAELPGDWSARSGHDAVAALPELPDATAYVAANDQMALGVMLALRERGLRIPEDVSVAGIDDIPEAAYFDPPLTTLRIDFAARGRQAFGELVARIDEGAGGAIRAPGRPELIRRRSTGRRV
ncbi:LacI family DNA-binding transcriptional regulator [Microbacterium excoecariae]|uniref:LacI family DNA-binding transcriptional regulator n=1 Tax=Microbacterium excoecariae TaxID=2715210 RepID=UPI001409C1B0|nr:LacI family DNA-binding transcriptional regulator [Microbacterium excoecariae]NHI17774.1 LacI family transcriptional regulator [Microbacterium excoecariae]